MSRLIINLNSDDSLLYQGPTDVSDPSTPVPIESPTTKELRIYDVTNQPHALMNGDSAADVATFKLIAQDLFAVDQQIAVRDDSNAVFTAQVLSVDTDENTITLDAPLAGGAFIPNRRRFFVFPGAVVIDGGDSYGTPVANDPDWGFPFIVDHDHPGLYNDQEVIAEFDFDGGPGLRDVVEKEARVLKANT